METLASLNEARISLIYLQRKKLLKEIALLELQQQKLEHQKLPDLKQEL
ncbi:hypothetical protein CCACVL1_11862 [Corchorus capsularis]|uniref:Uncharacterized protein n=1 Tax=Corchorus capsularis TaxID=210143 RepID=A0A1R3IJ57_COCAP|nr:hypothetical protein CCACVL1_11862 [Corchorus capsularis]